jgi:hypothetical protein
MTPNRHKGIAAAVIELLDDLEVKKPDVTKGQAGWLLAMTLSPCLRQNTAAESS